MEPRLKERLIGAVVLVAIGVLVIPLVLDGPDLERKAGSVSLQLPAPDESVPLRTQTIDLSHHADAAPAASVASGSSAQDAVVSNRAARTSTPAPVAATRAPATSEPAPTAGTVDEAWMVQLGSFGEAENANRLAGRVAVYGFDADVSTYQAGGRVMHRVRIGPHDTRKRAEAAASSLSAHGFLAQVVSTN